MNLQGAPKRFTPAEKSALKKKIIAGIRDGHPLVEIALMLGFNSAQAMCWHFPRIHSEALRKIRI